VLNLLRRGLANQLIADRLGISLPGARYHVSEILSKLGVESRQERRHGRVWRSMAADAGCCQLFSHYLCRGYTRRLS
jgi:Bacterial regulatory proteins, luxR family